MITAAGEVAGRSSALGYGEPPIVFFSGLRRFEELVLEESLSRRDAKTAVWIFK